MNEDDLLAKGFVRQTDGSWRKPANRRVAPDAVMERDRGNESVAEDAGKTSDTQRRVVRFTSYRLRLCDERNLADKHFTDSLVRANLLVDDSPKHVQIEVSQVKVDNWWEERTEIEITKETP